MKKRVLITGCTGFVGSYLAKLYLEKGNYKVYGTKRWRSPMDMIKHHGIEDKIIWCECDLTDAHSVQKTIKEVRPNIIHHLAAQSYVRTSWVYPVKTMQVNIIGSLNLFEAIKEYVPNCVVQVASTSEVYGIPTKKELPIKETMLPRPCSPYGVSKYAMDTLASQYVASYGLNIVITRAFNHSGAGRGEVFVISSFAKQIAEIEKGKREPVIMHGNLGAYRDFTDVVDICRAYYLAIKKCEYGTPYNVCSGNKIKIQGLLNKMIKMSKVKITAQQDPHRMRPSDLWVLQGDPTKFKKVTGWQPKKDFDITLQETLDFWRKYA